MAHKNNHYNIKFKTSKSPEIQKKSKMSCKKDGHNKLMTFPSKAEEP